MLVCYVFHFLCAHPAWQRDPNSSLGLGGRSFQRVPSFPLACLLGRGLGYVTFQTALESSMTLTLNQY